MRSVSRKRMSRQNSTRSTVRGAVHTLMAAFFLAFPLAVAGQDTPGANLPEETPRTFFREGNRYLLKGRLSPARLCFEQAIRLAGNDTLLMTECYGNLGSVACLSEDYGAALTFYQKALALNTVFRGRDPAMLARTLVNIGTVLSETGMTRQALEYYLKADSLYRSFPDGGLFHARIAMNMAALYLNSGQPDSAILLYHEALEHYCRLSDRDATETALLVKGLASCYRQEKRFREADSLYDVAFDMYRNSSFFREISCASLFLDKGILCREEKKYPASVAYFDSALLRLGKNHTGKPPEEAEETLEKIMMFRILKNKAAVQALMASGPTDPLYPESFRNYVAAITIIDPVNRAFGEDISRLVFNENAKTTVGEALKTGFRLMQSDPAFDPFLLLQLSEKVRNRILLSGMMTCQNEPAPRQGKDIRQQKEELAGISRRLFAKGNEPVKAWQKRDLEDLFLRFDLKEQQYDLAHPAGQVPPPAEPVDTTYGTFRRTIIQSLAPGEVILDYFLGDDAWFGFAITRDGITVHCGDSVRDLVAKARAFERSLKHAEIRESDRLGKALYTLLISPFAARLEDVRHLVIMPDEELALIPFETLIDPVRPAPGYLITRYSISYQLSVNVWLETCRRPVSDSLPRVFAGFAPVIFDPSDSPGLRPLPGTEEELKAIAGLFNGPGETAILFTGPNATERNFRNEAPRCSVIHLATHTISAKGDPWEAGMVFAPEKDSPSGAGDGIFYRDEAECLPLHAGLVVLSSCSSGKGTLTKTESRLALSRAFLMAGAGNVVCSLWNVRDNHTRDFMVDFYRNFLSGMSYPEALRAVKLRMLSTPGTSLPLVWAGFVIMGR
jgi:CHAT domain-containing protein/tetratricopeptide (TPR) repeat protein